MERLKQLEYLFDKANNITSTNTDDIYIDITDFESFMNTNKAIDNPQKEIHEHSIEIPQSNSNALNADIPVRLKDKIRDLFEDETENNIDSLLIDETKSGNLSKKTIKQLASEINISDIELNRIVKIISNEISETQFQKMYNLLFAFANELSEKTHQNIQLKKLLQKINLSKKKLIEKEALYQAMIDSSPENITITDLSGEIIKVSPAAITMFKYTQFNPSIKNTIYDFIHPNDSEQLKADIDLLLKQNIWEPRTYRAIKKDKSIIWVDVNGKIVTDKHGKPKQLIFVVRDITNQKKRNDALYESERNKSVLLSNLPGMAYRCKFDKNWTMLFVSGQCFALTGYHKEQLIGNNVISFNEIILPKYHDFLWKKWSDGVENHDYVRVEYEIITADNKIKWVWEQGLPIYDKNGNIEALEGFIVDITDRKKFEEDIKNKNTELSMINAEKDKFFSIIAHDLRSPFNSFLGLTQIMSDEFSSLSQQEIRSFIESMKSSATNLYSLLENLLEWACMKRGHISFFPKPLSTQTIIYNGIQPLIEYANTKKISLIVNPENVPIVADEHMLSSVVRNLVSNALKFTPTGGKIVITARKKESDTEIQIADNGIGMSEEILDSLFSLDKQTKRKGTNGEPSSGLGLVLCKEFVQCHQGEIWAKSKEGAGTTLYLTIPDMQHLH